MVKYLKYFLLLIPFIFITNVNAAQYNHDAFTAQLYDNRGGSLIASSTSDTGASYYGVLDLTGYGTGGAWGISSPTILLANHTYVLTANISLGSSNLALSSINRIGLGTTLEDARVSYQNNTYAEELYSRVVGTDLVQFAFKSSINGSYIVFPFTSTSSTQTDIFLSYVNFEDLGEGGLSQTDITNSLNSQTNNINNNSNQNRDAIINNQNQNTQDIIDNQNQNFGDLTSSINSNSISEINNQRSLYLSNCNNAYNFNLIQGKKYTNSNTVVDDPLAYSTEGYISIGNNVSSIYILNPTYSTSSYLFITYDENYNIVNYVRTASRSISISSNEKFFRFSSTVSNTYVFKNSACIDKQTQNTQDIIDNQNQNTQQEIESQKVCSVIDNKNIVTPNKYLQPNGSVVSSSSTYGITDYISINSTTTIKPITLYDSNSPSLCFYNINKSLISCINNASLQINTSLTIPSNSSFVRFSIKSDENKPTFEICKNGNQALTDSITSEENPNTNQDINDMNNMVASDTPISDLITMPLTLINAYINGVNTSCSPINLGNLYGTDLVLPCINLEQRLGSNLWHIIDAFFSIFMCYNIGMLFITAFDGITSLRDDFEGLYQPRHADTGYSPKHGG